VQYPAGKVTGNIPLPRLNIQAIDLAGGDFISVRRGKYNEKQ
jgi:hypothetical protein